MTAYYDEPTDTTYYDPMMVMNITEYDKNNDQDMSVFILFDVETAFLFPWATNFKNAPETFGIMLLFLATLLLGYVYALGKGALDWEK